ncbi:MAG: hypothetical protein AzoDbin1_04298 [Azoarcus sp.]|nr:hypothetical protein [Azoarcus sp.]
MPVQPADRKRCVSCKRWGGARKPGANPGEVEYEDDARGPCNEGPWHGTLRSPRNACGQWVMWAELTLPDA